MTVAILTGAGVAAVGVGIYGWIQTDAALLLFAWIVLLAVLIAAQVPVWLQVKRASDDLRGPR